MLGLESIAHSASLSVAGLMLPSVWSWLSTIPWWGWGAVVVGGWFVWNRVDPDQRVRRAAGYAIGGVPESLRPLLHQYGAGPFIVIGQVTGGKHAEDVFERGLPVMKGQINSANDLIAYGAALAKIAELSGDNTKTVFDLGLPAVIDQIKSADDLITYGRALATIAGLSGHEARSVFDAGLQAVKDQIKNVSDLTAYGRTLSEIASAYKWESDCIFRALKRMHPDLKHEPNLLKSELLLDGLRSARESIGDLSKKGTYHPGEIVENYNRGWYEEYIEPRVEYVGNPDPETRKSIEDSLLAAYDLDVGIATIKAHLPKASPTTQRIVTSFLSRIINQTARPDVAPEQIELSAAWTCCQLSPAVSEADGLGKNSVDKSVAPGVIDRFLSFLKDNSFWDAVLIGGAPRDKLRGRDPKDLDITFSLNLSARELAQIKDERIWNTTLGEKVDKRIQALSHALGVSVGGFLRGEARFNGLPVQYAGPFHWLDPATGGTSGLSSRFGIVINRSDGQVYSLGPLISVEVLGLYPSGRWTGYVLEATADIQAKRIGLIGPCQRLEADHISRYLYLKKSLGFEPSPEMIDALRCFSYEAQRHPDEFLFEASRYSTSFQGNLLKLLTTGCASDALTELDTLGLTELIARTEGPGANALNTLILERRLAHSSPLLA